MNFIINADDFGLSRGVNLGVLDAHHRGVVRSTSLMPNGPAFLHAVDLATETPTLGVGVHLTLTAGRPLVPGLRTLTGADGRFHCLSDLMEHLDELDPGEIEVELTAQLDQVLRSGLQPTHLDTHHHVHMLTPIFPLFTALAARHGLPARMRVEDRDVPRAPHSPDLFVDAFYGPDLSEEDLIELLLEYAREDRVVEIMCHPAYLDEELLCHSSYALPRARELAILTSPAVLECVRRHGLKLVNFAALGVRQRLKDSV